ncbi:MAG: DUF5615 family PIN-like protein [Cyanobacteria bacterium J06614_10]
MKLLFDHNLSPQLVARFSDRYPNSQHVFLLGMDRAGDGVIWDYAKQNDFVIVTRDSDYNDLSIMNGFPPKVIWIRCGNCSTTEIEQLIRTAFTAIESFERDQSLGVLTLT